MFHPDSSFHDEIRKINRVFDILLGEIKGVSLDELGRNLGQENALIIAKRLADLRLARIIDGVVFPCLSEDSVFPESFTKFGDRYNYYPVVTSTMDIAADLALKGCPDFTIVAAESQVSGRGRLGRHWVSEPGGIFFTLVLKPSFDPGSVPMINFMVSTVLVSLLRTKYGIDALAKWPNDILAGGGKLAGMISESVMEDGVVRNVNVGLGINVNNLPPEAGQPSSSVSGILGRLVSRREFFRELLLALEHAWLQFDSRDWISEARKCSATIGRRVRVEGVSGGVTGEAVDIDDSGSLVIRLDDSSLMTISFGDCIHAYI